MLVNSALNLQLLNSLWCFYYKCYLLLVLNIGEYLGCFYSFKLLFLTNFIVYYYLLFSLNPYRISTVMRTMVLLLVMFIIINFN